MSQSRAAYRVDYEFELDRQVRLAGLPEPVRQHKFHPVRRWRFDLAFPDHMLAVEVDGGIWTDGRHTRGADVPSIPDTRTDAEIEQEWQAWQRTHPTR